MSTDNDYQRAVVEPDSKSRLRAGWDALQERFTQTVETVTRSSRLQVTGGNVEDLDPPEDIDEYHDLYRTTGIVRANINQFTGDVTEPGARVEAEDDRTEAYFMGGEDAPESTPAGGFLENCAVIGGEKHQPFLPLLKSATTNRRTRGTVLIEYLKDDPEDPESQITGFKMIRPETVSARTYENTNILIDPDDTENADVTTPRGEAAAYVQFDEQSILGQRGGFRDKKTVPLSQNDVLKQTFDPDIGGDTSTQEGVFGTSIIEAVADDVEEYKEIKRDRALSIKTKAYGLWTVEFDTNVVEIPGANETIVQEWPEDDQDAWLNEVNELGPGDMLGHDGSITPKKWEGEVPDVDDTLQHYVDDILAALPAPKYATAHGEQITQHVTDRQETAYQDTVREERKYQARSWTQAFREVAERHPDLDSAGLEVRLEPEEDESPIMSLSDEDVERIETFAGAMADLFGPGGAPSFVDEETLLTLVLQLPEDASIGGVEDLQETESQDLDEDDEQVQEQFAALMDGIRMEADD